ncbi:hypothetical protein DVK00_02895 [Haloarcula sp. Atlit-47R]|nr:hypothetical protein DVK00_02895 [Haloarcula sp. Atlit-47R]
MSAPLPPSAYAAMAVKLLTPVIVLAIVFLIIRFAVKLYRVGWPVYVYERGRWTPKPVAALRALDAALHATDAEVYMAVSHRKNQ